MPVALVFWEELVDGGEDHTAGGDLQEFPQVRAALGLHRRLAQEIFAAREGAESCSSRSLRSVSTTMVGFSIAGSRMMRPA